MENKDLIDVLELFVAIDDAEKAGAALMSNQGQGMDGYTKLANYDSVVKKARVVLEKLDR